MLKYPSIDLEQSAIVPMGSFIHVVNIDKTHTWFFNSCSSLVSDIEIILHILCSFMYKDMLIPKFFPELLVYQISELVSNSHKNAREA